MLQAKRLRKESRVQRLTNQLGLMTYIANQYEQTLIQLAQYADKYAYGPNLAKKVLQDIKRQLRG